MFFLINFNFFFKSFHFIREEIYANLDIDILFFMCLNFYLFVYLFIRVSEILTKDNIAEPMRDIRRALLEADVSEFWSATSDFFV